VMPPFADGFFGRLAAACTGAGAGAGGGFDGSGGGGPRPRSPGPRPRPRPSPPPLPPPPLPHRPPPRSVEVEARGGGGVMCSRPPRPAEFRWELLLLPLLCAGVARFTCPTTLHPSSMVLILADVVTPAA
jgi:hypothetical protein